MWVRHNIVNELVQRASVGAIQILTMVKFLGKSMMMVVVVMVSLIRLPTRSFKTFSP